VHTGAALNRDDPSADYLLAFPADQHITYSLQSQADLTAQATYDARGMDITLHFAGETLAIHTPMVGTFNVQNIMAAVGAAFALNCTPDTIRSGVASMPLVPGRMERIDEGQNFIAIVDFAHTPNALQKALEAARSMIPSDKRIIAVFGSAGLRDREKRRMMAEIGAQLADICVLTAEDPRTESLDAILQTMADGAISQGGVEGQTFYRRPDRGDAIAFACSLAHPGDVVIACGKGHEQSMAFGTTEYDWDDRDAMRAALHGQPLQTLPTAKA
jgi:UDP-N-acetylmuramoyl-L-alanyl-D-glutamate--2,6-diaminopimelate ligase